MVLWYPPQFSIQIDFPCRCVAVYLRRDTNKGRVINDYAREHCEHKNSELFTIDNPEEDFSILDTAPFKHRYYEAVTNSDHFDDDIHTGFMSDSLLHLYKI